MKSTLVSGIIYSEPFVLITINFPCAVSGDVFTSRRSFILPSIFLFSFVILRRAARKIRFISGIRRGTSAENCSFIWLGDRVALLTNDDISVHERQQEKRDEGKSEHKGRKKKLTHPCRQIDDAKHVSS